MKDIAVIKKISSLVLQGFGFAPASNTSKRVSQVISLVSLFSDLSRNNNLKNLIDNFKLSNSSYSSSDIDYLFKKYRLGGRNAQLAEGILNNFSIEILLNNLDYLTSQINSRDINVRYLSVNLAVKALASADIKKISSYSSFLERASRLQNTDLKRKIMTLRSLIEEYKHEDVADTISYIDSAKIINNPFDYSDEELELALIDRLKELEKTDQSLLHLESVFLESCLREENKEISLRARRILLKMGTSKNYLKKILQNKP